ncbi:DUF411 domain-containing protein [Salinarimonas sp.]|uniref:DUF411 domain-containing protein n=1 Tax=Salinarimonas sp. TaxID=2766526 RepID=UPI0032D8F996
MTVAMHRRAFLAGLAAAPLAAFTPARAQSLPEVVVWKDPDCGCCGAWVDHMRAAGFSLTVNETSDMGPVKQRLGVPQMLGSCHTATVDGYVLEGHVPAEAVKRLLAERPQAHGLSVPGMPIGSPGMEVPGVADEEYDVVLFGESRLERFSRYRGGARIG